MDPNLVKLIIYLGIVSTVFVTGLAVMAWQHRQREKELHRRLELAATSIKRCKLETDRLAGMVQQASSSFVRLGEAMTEMIAASPRIIEDIEQSEQMKREAHALFAAAWPDVPGWIYEDMPLTKALAEGIMEIENTSIDVGDEEDKERGEEYFD